MTDTNPKPHDAEKTELDKLRAEVERLTEELTKAKEAEQARAEDPVEQLREKAEEYAEGLSEKAQEGWDELQEQIAKNPVQSALVAFGLGFVFSRLLSR